ncbi:hypothetical protein CEXT_679491 [Caerostris extrusa]|uniref:Uncharacterized protein n=1 Tax=Caerostris extrusa TaxID=172846 RepID=A0AAV4YAB9_CAEEX|nr:hypothetical protein CEXT_679491 [Caerostris extrusa]
MACILIFSDATHLTSSPERLAIHSIFTESRAFLWARGTNAPLPRRETSPTLSAQALSISLIHSHLQPATGAFMSVRPVCISVAFRSKINIIGQGEVNQS